MGLSLWAVRWCFLSIKGNNMRFTSSSRLLAAALFASSSTAVLADEPSYGYIEGGVGFLDVDVSGSSTETGFFAGFSAPLGDSFYVTADYEEYDLGPIDLSLFNASLGFRSAINDRTDFNVELGYDDADAEFVSGDGFRGTVGLRSVLSPRFHTRAYAGYSTDSDFDNGDFLLGLEGNIPFNDSLALTLQAETFEFDLNLGRIGLRFMF